MPLSRFIAGTCVLLVLVAMPSGRIFAQNSQTQRPADGNEQPAPRNPQGADVKTDQDGKSTETSVGAKPSADPQAVSVCRSCRWLEFEKATLAARYRFIENSQSVTTNNQLQYSVGLKGRLKFDGSDRYSLNFGVASGNSFTGGWNTSGIGTGPLITNLYLKQLYFSAKPVEWVEVQFGGFDIKRGESTEITSYDDDNYMTGQRLIFRRTKDKIGRRLFFDEIDVTYGYVGDFSRPSVTKRLHRLNESNYHQILVSKKVGDRVSLSFDYTFESGVETLREAIKVSTKRLHALDSVRFQTYQRMDFKPDAGFALSGEKKFSERLTLEGGYAQIDRDYGGLNGDRYNRGKRVFILGTFNLSPEFNVKAFATRAVGNDYNVSNRTRFDLILNYDLLKSLRRTRLF